MAVRRTTRGVINGVAGTPQTSSRPTPDAAHAAHAAQAAQTPVGHRSRAAPALRRSPNRPRMRGSRPSPEDAKHRGVPAVDRAGDGRRANPMGLRTCMAYECGPQPSVLPWVLDQKTEIGGVAPCGTDKLEHRYQAFGRCGGVGHPREGGASVRHVLPFTRREPGPGAQVAPVEGSLRAPAVEIVHRGQFVGGCLPREHPGGPVQEFLVHCGRGVLGVEHWRFTCFVVDAVQALGSVMRPLVGSYARGRSELCRPWPSRENQEVGRTPTPGR